MAKRKSFACKNCGDGDVKTLPVGPRKKFLCRACAKLPEFREVVLKNIRERRRRREAS
jgi:hypothetical protein